MPSLPLPPLLPMSSGLYVRSMAGQRPTVWLLPFSSMEGQGYFRLPSNGVPPVVLLPSLSWDAASGIEPHARRKDNASRRTAATSLIEAPDRSVDCRAWTA